MSPGDYVIAALFGAVILVVGAGVLWRYVLGSPLVWTVELSRILFTWMIFVGAALAIKEGTHIRASLLVDRLGRGTARYVTLGCHVFIVAFLAVMVYFGLQYVRLESGSRTPALGLPQAYVWYAALPVSLSVGIYFAVRKAIHDWRNPPPCESAAREG